MPEENSKDNRLESLLSKLVDETIEEEELLRLDQKLDGNPDAQSHYLRYLDLHCELDRNSGEIDAPETTAHSKRTHWLPVAITALAAVIAITGIILFQGIDKPQPIVQVVASDGPVEWEGWNGETKSGPQSGTGLSPGTIETLAAKSWIEFTFPDGTTASLSGPSVLTIALAEGRKVLRLKKGNLSVNAARQPQDLPMLVVTASAEAVVLGTQFNIQADSFSTQLTVNEGKVRMKRLADGKTEDVSANQGLVAELETGTSFSASPHPDSVHSWKSNLTTDAIQGKREKSPSSIEGIRAVPRIWKGEPNAPTKPILLYSAVFDPSPRKSPPLQIRKGARIEIRGRMNHSHRIHTGFATNLDQGGFAGKYAVFRGTPVEVDENGQFQIELPISSFVPTNSRFPQSSLGQEMIYLWIQTVKSDAGLIIESVEIKE